MNNHADVLSSPELDGCDVRVIDGDRVTAVRGAMPGEDSVAEVADVFGLLADAGRVRILTALLEGEMCVCDIAAATGLSESAVSHALRLMRAHRVVRARRSGRMAYYRLDDAHVRMLLDLALTHTGHTAPLHVGHPGTAPGEAADSAATRSPQPETVQKSASHRGGDREASLRGGPGARHRRPPQTANFSEERHG